MFLRNFLSNEKLTLRRIEAFSDGVFAIVATLLVINIQVPELRGNDISHQLLVSILNMLPKIISYIISFVTVAMIWVNHNSFLRHVKHSDRGLLWINNFFLMFLAFIPFPTGLIGEYHKQPMAVALYGLISFLTSATFSLLCVYVYRNNLLHEEPTNWIRAEIKRNLIGPVLYLFSILISSVSPSVAVVIFFIVPILYFFPTIYTKGENNGS